MTQAANDKSQWLFYADFGFNEEILAAALKDTMEATAMVFSGILFRLTELNEIPIDFDEALWNTLVDHVTVYADERIVFSFMDGTEITEMV